MTPCPEHEVRYYPLAEELASVKMAQFVGVCECCAAVEYVKELPAGAKMAGEGNA
jgi:hypothetical protein